MKRYNYRILKGETLAELEEQVNSELDTGSWSLVGGASVAYDSCDDVHLYSQAMIREY